MGDTHTHATHTHNHTHTTYMSTQMHSPVNMSNCMEKNLSNTQITTENWVKLRHGDPLLMEEHTNWLPSAKCSTPKSCIQLMLDGTQQNIWEYIFTYKYIYMYVIKLMIKEAMGLKGNGGFVWMYLCCLSL